MYITEEQQKIENGWRQRLKKLEELKAPDVVIEFERWRISLIEDYGHHEGLKRYQRWLDNEQKLEKEREIEFFKNNKMRQEVVESLYQWFDNNAKDVPDNEIVNHTYMESLVDPVNFAKSENPAVVPWTKEEFDYGMYDKLFVSLIREEITRRQKEGIWSSEYDDIF